MIFLGDRKVELIETLIEEGGDQELNDVCSVMRQMRTRTSTTVL